MKYEELNTEIETYIKYIDSRLISFIFVGRDSGNKLLFLKIWS